MFKICFHISGRLCNSTSIKYVDCRIVLRDALGHLLFIYNLYYLSDRESDVCIEVLKMYHLPSVLATICRQHPTELVAAPHLTIDDFNCIMKTDVLDPFYEKLEEQRGNWSRENLQKIPVLCIGGQV